MTLIIGVRSYKRTYMISDGRIVEGNNIYSDTTEKIINHKGCLIGFAGNVYFKHIAEQCLPKRAIKSRKDIYKYLKSIKLYMSTLPVPTTECVWRMLIITPNGILYDVDMDTSVMETSFACVGGGAQFAQGYWMGSQQKDIPTKLRDTVITTATKDVTVGPNTFLHYISY